MKREEIPSFVVRSGLFNEEELALLCSVERLPDDAEVDEIRSLPEIQELSNAFIGDRFTREQHQLSAAKSLLAQEQITMAWKVLLL